MALLQEHIEGKYEILEKLKEGGMGAIYKVRHRLLDEIRVVKVIRSQVAANEEAGDRFLREAREKRAQDRPQTRYSPDPYESAGELSRIGMTGMAGTSRSVRLLGAWLALTLLAIAPAASQGAAAPARVNARTLVARAGQACDQSLQGLQGPSIRQDPRLAPVRQTLARMDGLLTQVAASLDAHDLQFFQALRAGSRTLAELSLELERAGSLGDPAIENDIRLLGDSYLLLRSRYGPEWVRFQSGQPLNDEERSRFERMRAMEAQLAGALEPLAEKAQAAGDDVTAGELALLISQATGIAQTPPTLDKVLDASVLADTIDGEWAATRGNNLANPANPANAANAEDDAQWRAAGNVVESLETDGSVGYVFALDLDAVQGWKYTEQPATSGLPTSRPAASGALDEALAARPVAAAAEAPPPDSAEESPIDGIAESGQADLETAAEPNVETTEPNDPETEPGAMDPGTLDGDVAGEPETVAPVLPLALPPVPPPGPPPAPPPQGKAGECTAESAALGCVAPPPPQ